MPRYDAVGFDLLTALLDTLPLWRSAAGDDDVGTRWHAANQRLLRGKPYIPFDELVHESAKEVGLERANATTLLSRWGEAQPCPDARNTLAAGSTSAERPPSAGVDAWSPGMTVRGSETLVTLDDGHPVLPTTVAEWDDWVAAGAVRNWAGQYGILAWLDRYGGERGLARDDQHANYDE